MPRWLRLRRGRGLEIACAPQAANPLRPRLRIAMPAAGDNYQQLAQEPQLRTSVDAATADFSRVHAGRQLDQIAHACAVWWQRVHLGDRIR